MTRQPDANDELREQLAHAGGLIDQQRVEMEQLYQERPRGVIGPARGLAVSLPGPPPALLPHPRADLEATVTRVDSHAIDQVAHRDPRDHMAGECTRFGRSGADWSGRCPLYDERTPQPRRHGWQGLAMPRRLRHRQ